MEKPCIYQKWLLSVINEPFYAGGGLRGEYKSLDLRDEKKIRSKWLLTKN